MNASSSLIFVHKICAWAEICNAGLSLPSCSNFGNNKSVHMLETRLSSKFPFFARVRRWQQSDEVKPNVAIALDLALWQNNLEPFWTVGLPNTECKAQAPSSMVVIALNSTPLKLEISGCTSASPCSNKNGFGEPTNFNSCGSWHCQTDFPEKVSMCVKRTTTLKGRHHLPLSMLVILWAEQHK